MNEILNSSYMKVLTVSGAFLILLPVGVSWYWGNISVYILSYILDCTSVDSGLEAPWILSLMRVTWTLGLLSHAPITGITGKAHATVFIGIFVFNIGIFLTYFSAQTSVVLTSVCMGGLVGFGKGLLEGATMNFVLGWAVDDAAFLKTLVLCAIPTGAIVISQFVTLHVNPRNLSPDLTVGHMMFFSERKVLERMPSMFIMLGVVSSTVQSIGLLMLREMDKEGHEETEMTDRYGSISTRKPLPIMSPLNNGEISGSKTIIGCGGSGDTPRIKSEHNETSKEASSPERNEDRKTTKDTSLKTDFSGDIIRDQNVSDMRDYKSTDLLLSGAFYAIAVAYLCGDTSFIVFKNYYKSYGQQSIKNDHFLAEAVIILSLVSIFCKIVWIFIMDRLGQITCMVGQFALMTLLTILVYFSPIINKWMYLFLYAVFNAVACSYDDVFTTISIRRFGKNIFNTNFGLVTIFTIGGHIATAPVLQALLNHWGWFAIFAYPAFLNFLGMFLLTTFYLKSSKCCSKRDN